MAVADAARVLAHQPADVVARAADATGGVAVVDVSDADPEPQHVDVATRLAAVARVADDAGVVSDQATNRYAPAAHATRRVAGTDAALVEAHQTADDVAANDLDVRVAAADDSTVETDQPADVVVSAEATGGVTVADGAVFVECGAGSRLKILEVQPAGKNVMSAMDWIRGFKAPHGLGFE